MKWRPTMKNQLTKSDVKKIEEEIEYRKLVVRKESIDAVKEARSYGDLSENFEYYAAKRDKNKNEGRIRYLEKMLKTAQIISDESGEDEIGMNDVVEVYFEEDDEVEEYKIVTSIRENALKGLISNQSPLGKALMGHKVNDRVYVDLEDRGGYYVVIKSIEKNVDDADDRIRGY
jgi:transcription elongation factor GreA